MKTKRRFEKAVRTTISFPPRLMQATETIFVSRGFDGLSSYLQELARCDIDKRKPQLLAPQ
jgi:hypothetical protein